MLFRQAQINLKPRPRGYHLITSEIEANLQDLKHFKVGMAQLFLQHTSASLTINENADPDVRGDFERWSNQAIPDGANYFVHTIEGNDDMAAHIKSSLMGCQVLIPVKNGRFALGTWQGIYLGEHRNYGGSRQILATIWGQTIDS
jgi:secondary thiamine-phosphate synthase enzyme